MEEFQSKDFSNEDTNRLEQKFNYYLKDFPLTSEDLQKQLLDVGAGTGDFVQYVRNVLGNKNAIGVERYENKLAPSIEGMVVADGVSLPFEDDFFEIVLAHNYLPMFVGDKEKMRDAINELLRVTKKGGKIMGDISTLESVLHSDNEIQADSGSQYSEKDRKRTLRRYVGSEDLKHFLETLKEVEYDVQIIKPYKNKTVVVIIKP